MQMYQREFIQFAIEQNVLKFGEFKLKSGRMSPYFFNAGLFNTGLKLGTLCDFYAQALHESGLEFDNLFGPAYKGIPLATSTATAYAKRYNQDVSYTFNRKEAKSYGEGGNMVGATLDGKVIIVDDVITAGTAAGEAVEMISKTPATITGMLVALDRQEKGQGELSAIQEVEKKYGFPVLSIINLDNILEYLDASGQYPNELAHVHEYQKQFGVKE